MSEEKMKKQKNKQKRNTALPPLMNAPCMEVSSNREVVLEGSRGVLEYSGETIRVNTAGMMISFFGRDLDLKCISESALVIGGFFTRIEFTL